MRFLPIPVVLGGLLLLQLGLVAGYVAREHTFYFWDHAMYWNMAKVFFTEAQGGFAAGWAQFQQALTGDYNLIFALPALVTFALFGTGRMGFILTNFLVFFLAYEAALALVLRRLFGLAWGRALVLSMGVCLLIPPLWLPLLEGYPDVGAAACLVLALAVGLVPAKTWRLGLGLGLLLASAVLLRRNYAYPVVALLATVGVFDLVFALREKDPARAVRRLVAVYALCGAGLAGLLYLVAPDFLLRLVVTDYTALYHSYKKPVGVFLHFVAAGFGGLLLIAGLTGLGWAAQRLPPARRGLGIVAGFALVWLAMWCAGSTQAGHHYMLHALTLLIAVGLGGWVAAEAPRRGLILGGAALALNTLWTLWLAPDGVYPNSNGPVRLLSAARPPVARKDYDELLALGTYLAATTSDQDRVMMVGSSFVINQDLIRAVFYDGLLQPDFLARMAWAPEIDGEQNPPFDAFAAATVYLVPEPAQYHLDPDGQRVVMAAVKQFPPHGAAAALFHMEKRVFSLNDGVTLRVWRRDPWTPAALQETLASLRAIAPGPAQDWVALDQPRQLFISSDGSGLTRIFVALHPLQTAANFFLDGPLPAGDFRLALDVAASCRAPRFELSALTPEGTLLWTKPFAPVVVPGSVYRPFTLTSAQAGSYLRLRLATASPGFGLCGVEARNLRLERL